MAVSSLTFEGISSARIFAPGGNCELWNSIVISSQVKERLLAYGNFVLSNTEKLDTLMSPPTGTVLLTGPPGTGKTSLGREVGSALCEVVGSEIFFGQISSHSMPGDLLGSSQKNVGRLFSETIPEIVARYSKVILLLDEVETLVSDRAQISLQSNPLDVLRAVDAVLEGFDSIVTRFHSIMFISTTNLFGALDPAFLSRSDLVLQITKPDAGACRAIIINSIFDIGRLWPRLLSLVEDQVAIEELAKSCVGLDARRISRLVIDAITSSLELSRDPTMTEFADLQSAVESCWKTINLKVDKTVEAESS